MVGKLLRPVLEATVDRSIMEEQLLRHAKVQIANRIMEQEVKLPNHVKVVTVDRTIMER